LPKILHKFSFIYSVSAWQISKMRNFSHRKVVFIFNHYKNPYISNNNICKKYIKNATSIIIEDKIDFNMNNANNKIEKKMN